MWKLIVGLFVRVAGGIVAAAGEIPVAVLLVVLLVLAVALWSFRVHGTLLSPICVFTAAWWLPPLSTYFEPSWRLQWVTWAVVGGSYVAFCAGYAIYLFIVEDRGCRLRMSSQIRPRLTNPARLRLTIYVLWVCGMVGFFLNLRNILVEDGLALYFEHGFREAEMIFGQSTLTNYLFFLNMVVVPLSALHLCLTGRKGWVLLCGLSSLFALPFHGNRSTPLMTVIITVWVVLLASRRAPLRFLVAAAVAVLLSFNLVTVGREPQTYLSRDFQEMLPELVRTFYFYIGPNFANLQAELQNRTEFNFGLSTLGPMIELITLRSFRTPFEPYLVQESLLFGTYLREFYTDFGIGGVVLGPFLVGLISAVVFLRFVRKPRLMMIFIYAVLLTDLSMVWQTNQFLRIQFLYIMTVVSLVDIMISTSKARGRRVHLAGRVVALRKS